MKNIVLPVIIIVLLIEMLIALPSYVFAQCDGSVGCTYVMETYSYDCGKEGYPQTCHDIRKVCRIYGSGGGSCTCCYNDACVAECGTMSNNTTPDPNDPNPPYCGNGTCDPGNNETCSNCPADCGACPTGNVQVRAMAIPSTATTCTDVVSSAAYIADNITLYPVGTTKTTSVDGSYATWNGVPVNTYGMLDTPPADYVLRFACYTKTGGAPYTNSYSASVGSGETVSWNLGYTAGSPWWQAAGGDVYGATTLRSYVPSLTSPRYAVLDGSGGSPGVVTYGASYDFSSASPPLGEGYVSNSVTAGWLANDTYPETDYYAVMYHRFGSPDPEFTGDTTFTIQPASGTHYVNGNLTITTADWSVVSDESIVCHGSDASLRSA
jgi:hypothetical protein